VGAGAGAANTHTHTHPHPLITQKGESKRLPESALKEHHTESGTARECEF